MICGPKSIALPPTDREALLYGKKQKSDFMSHQLNVVMVAALNYYS